MRHIFAAASLLALAACGLGGQDNADDSESAASTASAKDTPGLGYESYADDNQADSMASNDKATDPAAIADPEERPIMQAQVVLDRQGFGPGVIDGKMGMSTENALTGFQMAHDLEVTGELDDATELALSQWQAIEATRVVTIPANWTKEDYRPIPDEPAEQAELERLGYESLDERLAERFHTTIEVLKQLNPGGRPAGASPSSEGVTTVNGKSTIAARPPSGTPKPGGGDKQADKQASSKSYFRPGQQIRVPNIGGDRIAPGSIDNADWQRTLASLGVGSEQPDVARIVVSKSDETLKAYDEDDQLVAMFTVTSGSEHDPLPLGDWGITGVAHMPPFSFDPELFWDVPDTEEKQTIPPGPNGPVGVVWIDLTKEHYGIHGTPAPQTIGRAQSHGCVRLTNWDAARLAEMVSGSTEVEFVA